MTGQVGASTTRQGVRGKVERSEFLFAVWENPFVTLDAVEFVHEHGSIMVDP
jgi:hypothetical protein